MRAIVFDKFHTYKQNSEGNKFHLYCDVNKNITVGVGVTYFGEDHLLSGFKATKAHWSVKDSPGTTVTEAMMKADRKACLDLYATGVRKSTAYAEVTKLRLSPAGSKAMTDWKIRRLEPYVKQCCPTWNEYPADAHFACIAMMWGPGLWATLRSRYKALTTAIETADFARASTHITFPVNYSVKKREWLNKGFEFMLINSAVAVAAGLPKDSLYWPARWAYSAETEIAYEYDWMPEKL